MAARATVLSVMLGLVLLVQACGPLPQPFRSPPGEAANPLVAEAAAYGVRVEPLTGTTVPMGKLLAESVAAGFKLYGINATAKRARPARYRLAGQAKINDTRPELPYVVLIDWSLYDSGGKLIGRQTQGVPGSRRDWDFGSPAVITTIGEEAPDLIAGLIDKEEEGLKPVAPRLAGVWIEDVTGAPGDGNRSLSRAIRKVIGQTGLEIAPKRRFAEFVLNGHVDVRPPKDATQRVTIVWTVTTSDGREIGKATQKNLVKTGTFDGPWGDVADIVAEAARDGIEGVLRTAGAFRFALSKAEKVLKTNFPTDGTAITLPPPTLDIELHPEALEKP